MTPAVPSGGASGSASASVSALPSARELRADADTRFITAADLVHPSVDVLQATPVDAPPAQLGESAHWDDRDQTLYWVDIVGGALLSWPFGNVPVGSAPVAMLTGVDHISVVRAAHGWGARSLVMASSTGVSVGDVDIDIALTRGAAAPATLIGAATPTLTVRARFGRPGSMPAALRFNDGECDRLGRLWIGTLDDAALQPGRLYSLDSDGTWIDHLTDLDCPNGIGWSLDDTTIHLVESVSRRILSADFDLATGTARGWRVAVQFDPAGPMPDGLTVTADGGLWVAFWGGGCAVLLDSSLHIRARVTVPTPLVTSTAAARGLTEMFVTTARPADARPPDARSADPESPDARAADPAAGRLYRFSSPVAGALPHAFGVQNETG